MPVDIIEHAVTPKGEEENTALFASTLLSLDRAKTELRVPPGDSGQDDLIREQVKSAVSYIQEDLNIPIVKEEVYTVVRHGRSDVPITFGTPGDKYVLRSDKIYYQTEDVEIYTFGDWPEVIEIDDEHQIAPGVGDGNKIADNIIIKHPDNAWPAAASNHYAVHYTRGIKSTRSEIDTIRRLVILKLRDIFFGTVFMKGQESNTAYERMAKIIRDYEITHTIRRIT